MTLPLNHDQSPAHDDGEVVRKAAALKVALRGGVTLRSCVERRAAVACRRGSGWSITRTCQLRVASKT